MLATKLGIKMKIAILGAGLSGITTAYYLQKFENISNITLFEKEKRPFGLCQSIQKDGMIYDIGPHILFSKDKEMLQEMLNVLDSPNALKRSNKILYKGIPVQYPFENDLSKLPEEDLKYCINAFENNPYEEYKASNMIQFFLKTFGEGITNCYLRPYNEKIWKYDPAFMNTSMVDRIPKPTKEEIERSASGETVDGYVHQLYFSYPSDGGIEAVPQGFLNRLSKEKCRLLLDQRITSIEKREDKFVVTSNGEEHIFDKLISTIPVQELAKVYKPLPTEIKEAVDDLRYNSIAVAFVHIPYDNCGDNYAYMVPDNDVIFHRISKMDFLGSRYHVREGASYMIEVTYREGDYISHMTKGELEDKIAKGLVRISFAEKEADCDFVDITHAKFAYVIYDLNHGSNMEKIRNFFQTQSVILNGRFGNFEYWNMDKIVRESFELSKRFN